MKIEVLDHGYAELVESWGSDDRIIEAARMSTNKSTRGWGPKYKCPNGHGEVERGSYYPSCPECGADWEEFSGDEKLLRYLYENKHSTPFEMAGMTIEVGAPILTFRQWHRHRTQSYNEMSARYTPLPAVDYVPTLERLMGQAGISIVKNKQAGTVRGANGLTDVKANEFIEDLRAYQEEGQKKYEKALNDGVPKELARLFVTVGRYSRMRASANLRNWLAFLTLRMHGHAQYEIRVYADAVGEFVRERFPRTWELFIEGMEG